jgi:hypothetical protein
MAVTGFSGVYGFASALLLLRRSVEDTLGSWLSHRHIPLIADPTVEVNLIPVDAVARHAVEISVRGPVGQIYHLTNAAAPSVGETADAIFLACGLREPRYVDDQRVLTAIDRRLDDAMAFYASYMRNGKSFDRTHTDAICGADSSRYPLPAESVNSLIEWYRDRLGGQVGRITPKAHPFAFRKVMAARSS